MSNLNFEDYPAEEEEFNWDQYPAVTEPSMLDNIKQKGREFGSATVRDLPAIGAGIGSGLGFVSPIPGGAFGGAAIGAYSGQAAKNLINTYIDPEDAPQTDLEYITGPLEEGANAITGEAIGQKILGPAVNYATKPVIEYVKKGINKGTEVSGRVSDYILKKMGKSLNSIPENYTEAYLKRRGKINARPSEEILDEISTLHDQGRQGVHQAENDLNTARFETQQRKDSLAARKQALEDQYADERYLTAIKAETEKDNFSKAAQAAKEDLQKFNILGLRNRILESVKRLKEKVNNDSINSYEILSDKQGTVSSKTVLNALDQGMKDLTLDGQILTKTDQAAFDELMELRERLSQMDGQIRYPAAKFLLQRLGHDTEYKPNAGAYAKLADQVKQNARKALDTVVKDEVSEYRAAMLKLDADTRLLKSVSEKFGTEEAALSRLENIATRRGQHIDFELLKNLAKATGENFEKPIQEFIRTKDLLRTPSQMRMHETQLPEYGPFKVAQREKERYAIPATRRQIRDRVSQSIEQQALQNAEKEMLEKQGALSQSQDKFKVLAPFNRGSVQAKAKALTGARDYAPKKLFSELDQATGKDFTNEIKDRAILDSFEKGDTQGSRKTLVGSLIGKSIAGVLGALGGYHTSGGAGATLGGLAGFHADKYAGTVVKFLLNRRINATQAAEYLRPHLGKFTDIIVKAAERGPEALGTVGAILATDPEFKKILESQ